MRIPLRLILCAPALALWACSAGGGNEASAASSAGQSRGDFERYSSGPPITIGREVPRTAYDESAQEASRTADGGAEDSGAQAAFTQSARKLIYEASLRLRVTDLEEAEKPVEAALKKHNGYAANTSAREDSRSYTLRVPSSAYQAFLADLSPLGTVLYREESADDATLRYYDLEGRLATKKALLATFQSYLGKAKNIEEILSVEERIAGLQSEIEDLGSRFKTLSDLIDYATVHLELQLPASANPAYKPGIGERIGELFGSFGDFLETALLVITGLLIYGLPALAFAAFAYWLLLGKVGLLRALWRMISKKAKL